jgi:hypothetical protein
LRRDGFLRCQYAQTIPSDQVTTHHLIQVIRVGQTIRNAQPLGVASQRWSALDPAWILKLLGVNMPEITGSLLRWSRRRRQTRRARSLT